MTKITYGTKTAVEPQVAHATQWWADDANEVKTTVNENDTVDTSTSATVLFDQVTGCRHGTWANPITGDITLDETGVVEGGCAVVIWRGATNPIFIGGTIQSTSGVITVDGIYSVYLMYINGRFNVNIFNVANPGAVFIFSDLFTGGTIDTAKWTIVNPASEVVFSQNNELIETTDGTATSGVLADYLYSAAFTLPTEAYLSFDILMNNQAYKWGVGFIKQADPSADRIVFQDNAQATILGTYMYENSVNIDSATDFTSGDKTVSQSYRIKVTASAVVMQKWNGSAWATGKTVNTAVFTGVWNIAIFGRSLSGTVGDVRIDNIYMTDTTFSTKYPIE